MARIPKGNDKDQIKAISSGIGDVAVVNSYYVGKLINSNLKEERNSVNLVSLLFPNQNNRGSHVNISGVGLSLHSPNKKNGIKLMKFLLANEAQGLFSRSNFEYPVKSDIK
jgi:iron(III) transport system substrate-binding protein